jgi:hypothetical protein
VLVQHKTQPKDKKKIKYIAEDHIIENDHNVHDTLIGALQSFLLLA